MKEISDISETRADYAKPVNNRVLPENDSSTLPKCFSEKLPGKERSNFPIPPKRIFRENQSYLRTKKGGGRVSGDWMLVVQCMLDSEFE